MLFNSGTFLLFFAAFLLLYYLCRNSLTIRNLLIVAASFLFYGWWDYRFLGLLVASSVLDFMVALGLERIRAPSRRKLLLFLSMGANLSILGFFKYFNFFTDSFAELARHLGWQVNFGTLEVILPVGISFYTFQTMSYAIDVYRGEIKATRNLVHFLAYVSFFPQLVAGPIERARHLLPQFERPVVITRAMIAEGVWLGIWGMFKKVVIADNLAPLVEMVYGNSEASGLAVVLATVAFALQIYCDFSGYSDIARGTARILGIDIMFNFNLPYAARSIREFWQRWHISLSTWLRDYLYIPLGGNRRGALRTHLNLFATMLLGGLWHGASWNFVLWGGWHALALIVHRTWNQRSSTRLGGIAGWLITLSCVGLGWALFRAGSMQQAAMLVKAFGNQSQPIWISSYCVVLAIFSLPLVAIELWQFKMGDLLAPLRLPAGALAMLEGFLLIGIIVFWEKDKVPFIYFQF